MYNPVHDAIHFRANTFVTLEHELNISFCDNSLRYKSLRQLRLRAHGNVSERFWL